MPSDEEIKFIKIAIQQKLVTEEQVDECKQAHKTLTEMGFAQIGPESGRLACGTQGPGRMSEPCDIIDRIEKSILNEQKRAKAKPEPDSGQLDLF